MHRPSSRRRTITFVLLLAPLLSAGPSPRAATTHAAESCASVDVLVRVDWDPSRAERVSGVVTRVRYPSSLDLPLDRNGRSVQGRVELRTAASGGLFDAVLNEGAADGGGDMVSVGLINAGIARGEFARIRFLCRAGASTPAAADFGCTADIADPAGSVPSSCSVTIEKR